MRIVIVATAIFFGLTVQTVQAQITSPDTLVHRIFNALKNKDEKAFVALYPTSEQMTRLLKKVVAGAEEFGNDSISKRELLPGGINQEVVKELQEKMITEDFSKEYDRYARNFQNIILAGESKGIDWGKAVLVKYWFDTTRIKDEMMVMVLGSNAGKMMTGFIEFTFLGRAYQVHFKETLYLPDEQGWFGAELHRFSEAGNAPGDAGSMDNPKMKVRKDSSAPLPPIKPKTKSTKSTSSKPKSKSNP